jgi:putative methyltransferase (TIGR04325 family)
VRGASRVPLLRSVVSGAYQRYFVGAGGTVRLFHGIYPDFASAMRSIPSGRHCGYDNEPSAGRVMDEWLRIWPYDYPVMFWLSKLLPECKLLFDWGGNAGLKYFAYKKYLHYSDDLTWCVNDVPAVVAVGERVATREAARALRFTTSLDELAFADVLLAAGSIHFIDEPFALLRAAAALPRHLLLSKVPAYDLPSAVTLHNMGSALCPYHLFNRDQLVANVLDLGYRLIDEWKSPDCACELALFPNHSIPAYSGFYFSKAPAC